ncbi:PREDICTED: uncharacterized protein LOC104596200 [Nelumbo nucifera]|uniref:Uncharacterized protein LOC104596200 n=2 Tax=Nelumbo nucifera TaxID=4432 RepID=A0A1U7ZQ90_NELNU|nr:PREDICTED: uncharacterized protein LOC104596200 [Nelumbo nucifera]DAD34734.1 TPA_asm: hypothetical protein HUJ06_005374 [Nelumbo nucifera]
MEMEGIAVNNRREMEGEKTKKEDNRLELELEIVLVTLGTVLLVAGLKHAMTSLLEQWRALVFLLLNLVLLSILFMSIPSSSASFNHKDYSAEKSTTPDGNDTQSQIITNNGKSKEQCTDHPAPAEEDLHNNIDDAEDVMLTEPVDDDDDGEGNPRLTKEELNARVEAFILMFRQQLALDAKRGGFCFASRVDSTPSLGVVS